MPDDQSNPESAAPRWSRYERVKQILNEASGDAHPSYQGHDRFWNLPHAQFLEVTLYGIRMIAPSTGPSSSSGAAPAQSCCHGPAPTAAAGPQAGRGAASGLIKGLKGQPPFDGSQFPKLPWGGSAVPYDDIAFIEQWIDDGCPENDASSKVAATAGSDRMAKLRGLASGNIAHALHQGPLNRFQEYTGKTKIRKNIDFLTPEELERFRNAVARMKSLDQYEQDERSFGYWARIHANQCQHSWEQFLTWHRAYLYFFEQQLQDVDPTVTLPYWDWTSYRADLEASIADMTSSAGLDNGVVPESYRCWIDQPGLDELKAKGLRQAVLDKLASVLNQKFDSGNRLFLKAGIRWADDLQSNRAIVGALEKINPLWHYQRWPGGNPGLIFEAYPRPEDVDRILQLDDFFSFGSGPADNHFFGALENIHNLIHNFSGGINPNFGSSTEPMSVQNPQNGDMVNAGRTAFDPIFWGHHANCDRLWAEWQKLHTKGGPDDPDDILPPWNMTVEQTYNPASLGYQYMQSSHVFPASSEVSIARFVSAPAAVHPKVTATHRHAEVRLDRVQYSTRAGFFIRVFLNQPDANTGTATVDNPHYVGMLNMFTGLCIGGPGHCDPPPARQRRKFDYRPHPHKTPAAFRIDATAAVARLKALGETDFQVTLVVVNLDGSLAADALHLEGVSLNFFD
jgi:tyrosinase